MSLLPWKKSRVSRRDRNIHRNRRLLLESLESRTLLAADALAAAAASQQDVIAAEGESRALANLADFATALSDAGVVFYGWDQCPACARQRAMFGSDDDLLPYVNTADENGVLNDIGVANNITTWPTWVFPDGNRLEGVLSLDELSENSGVPLPTNIVVINTNRGPIEIKTRADAAPQTVANWLKYANDGDYDNTIFHRLVPNFVLQGGGFATTSETFTNTAQFVPVPTDPPVVNEFNISNTRGTVAMAKLGGNPDSATSQFFFNAVNNAGNLDNQNGGFTVFAEVVDMARVDELMQTPPFNIDGQVFSSLPLDGASQNELLAIRSLEGSGEITGIAFEDTDGDGVRDPGESPIEGMTIFVDANDNGQFDAGELSAMSDANGAYSIVVGDSIRVVRVVLNSNEFATTGNAGRHVVDLDIGGVANLDVGRITVGDVGAIDLHEDSDTGPSNTDNITNADNSTLSRALDFVVSGALPNAVVRLFAGGQQLGQAAADASGVASIRTNGSFELDGDVAITADQILNTVAGPRNTSLDITVDDVAPVFNTTSPTLAKVAVELSYDASTDGEGAGVAYSLQNAPTGAVIDPATGQLSWTPTAAQVGDHAFSILAVDQAGNEAAQPLNVQVLSNEQLIVRLETVDLNDNVITEIDAGEQFKVRGFVSDNSLTPQGVAAAFFDLIYQNQLVIPNDVPIAYGANFPDMQSGDIDTLGVVNELGAGGNSTVVDDGELLLFEVTFTANIGGVETFTGEAADEFPASESFLIGDANPLSTDVIKVESTNLTVNLSFGANGEKFGIDEDSGENEFDVLANDQRFEGSNDDLVITGSSLSAQGATIRIAEDGKSIFYTPPQDFVGDDSFTYTVSDGNGTDSATVIVNVLDVNDPPTANDDTFNLDEDALQTLLDVTQNDSIAPDVGETLQIIGVSATDNGGIAQIGGAGSFILYTPGLNRNGVETFTYTIDDGRGGTSEATVTVNLAAVNDDPTAVNDNFNIDEDAPATVFFPLDNDTSLPDDNETLTVISVSDVPAEEGTVAIVQNGDAVEFTPAPDFHGTVFVNYTISDGNGGESTNTMIFRVASVNDPPAAGDDAEVITKNTGPHTFSVLGNDSFAPDENETLTVINISGVANGTAEISSDQTSITYTPDADFVGEETITYTISDGEGGEATATLTITVRDFVPSSVSGAVFIDANNNGLRDFGETPVGGVVVKLSGQDNFGVDVTLETTTDASGDYSFVGLAPGNYDIEQMQPAHLINGAVQVGTQGGSSPSDNMLQIALQEGTTGEANNFTERGRAIQFVRLRDFFFRPAMPQIEVFENTGNGSQSFALGQGWDDVSNLQLTTPDNGAGQAVLELTYSTGGQRTVEVPLEQVETRVAGNQIYRRIASSLADLGADLSGAVPQGEGERNLTPPPLVQPVIRPAPTPVAPPLQQPVILPAPTPVGDNDPVAEGEAAGVPLTRQTESFAASNAPAHAQVVQDSTDQLFEAWPVELDADVEPQTVEDDGEDYAAAVDELLGEEADEEL